MTDEEQANVIKTNPFYAAITIPVQKDVKGMDAPAKSIAYDVFWIAHKDMPDETIYDMLKVTAISPTWQYLVFRSIRQPPDIGRNVASTSRPKS